MDVSIVIVNFNTRKLTIECIRSVLRKTKGINYSIILIDNGSSDGSVKEFLRLYKAEKRIELITLDTNLGFGKANNIGLKRSTGKYVLLLNSDTLIKDNVIGEMVHWMEKRKQVGVSTCSLMYPNGQLQGTGGYFPTLVRVFSWMTIQDLPLVDNFIKPFHPMKEKSFKKGDKFYKKEKEIDWVTGAFFMLRMKTYEETGGFDEDYFMYTEETDLCFRIKRLGWKIIYTPKWKVIHYGGASGDLWSFILQEYEGVKLFYKKHYPTWQFPLLRLILKLGSFGRIFVFGTTKGKEAAKAYAEAFIKA